MRFPYKLYIEETIGGGFDENGFMKPSEKITTYLCDCRDTPNGSGKLITTANGDFSNFDSLIYTNKSLREIEINTILIVKDSNDNVRLSKPLIRQHNSQLNCRLWV